jgi:hypothetical protein
MKRIDSLVFIFVLAAATLCFAQGKTLMLDDFEVEISGGKEGTVDFGAGNGSSVEVTAEKNIKFSGLQAIKVTYDAVPDGYMYIARGTNLDAKNASWQVKPQDIKWEDFYAISFYMYGTDSKAKVAVDIKDNGNELWRFIVEDNFKGWKQVICAFDAFFARRDWQPANADRNANLDFPLKSYQFEPLPEGKGTLYFDAVELVEK